MGTIQKRWIFRYKGSPSDEEGARLLDVLKDHSIEIVDNALPRMLLVSGSQENMDKAKSEVHQDWTVALENSSYPIPDTKKKLR